HFLSPDQSLSVAPAGHGARYRLGGSPGERRIPSPSAASWARGASWGRRGTNRRVPGASRKGDPMRRLILFFITSALAFLLSAPAQGQEAGTLTGVVEDPSGAPIPGAHLKLAGKATAEVVKADSDETGQFEFRNLPEGKYVLSAQAHGVEPIEMVVTIGAHPAAPMRIRMEIAELKEEVT